MAATAETFEKLNMTSDEIKTFTEAMKKEEFRKLFMEYAQELQDPEKRRQYEEELEMLESQRGVDMKFVKPDPGFVLKVQDTDGKKVSGGCNLVLRRSSRWQTSYIPSYDPCNISLNTGVCEHLPVGAD